MSNTTINNGSRGQVPAAVIAKAKPPKEPRRKRSLKAARPVTVDPVLALWKEVLKTEHAVNTMDESDEVAYRAAQQRQLAMGNRFMAATPTTALGIAAKLKYLAILNCHAHPGLLVDSREVELVRGAVRQLTGDPNWTIEQEG